MTVVPTSSAGATRRKSALWRDVLTFFRQAGDSEQRRAASHMGRLLKLMQEYKDAYPAETADFDAAVESIPEFHRELARIERDDLPKYTERFRRMRDEKVIEAIALFQADLYKYIEEIEENMADLNQSLQSTSWSRLLAPVILSGTTMRATTLKYTQ